MGLALLVLVANAGTNELSGEALRVATAHGLSNAVLVVAAAIAAIAVVALNLKSAPVDPAATPCPRALAALTRPRTGRPAPPVQQHIGSCAIPRNDVLSVGSGILRPGSPAARKERSRCSRDPCSAILLDVDCILRNDG